MSTHNIGFYENLTKIIFELSSNIIKYAPYFFCCCSPVPTVVGATTSKSPARPPTEGSNTTSVHVDESKPSTSIQIRLADGSR